MSDSEHLLWNPTPERVENARISAYLRWLAEQKGLSFSDYESLWQWSTGHVEDFWASMWEYFGLPSSYDAVLDAPRMPGARWFTGASLNFTSQLQRFASLAEKPAILSRGELRGLEEMSWNELLAQVASVAQSLRALGVGPGDRVAAYLPNVPETVVAFFACAAIGAVWSSCSPDMGPASVLDRFRQIDPKVLIAVDGYRYGGKDFDRLSVVRELRSELKTLKHTVLLPHLDSDALLEGALPWSILLEYRGAALECTPLPFDHPLWVLYSSGTTGMPKPIVHGAGGTLIEALKGHALHLDLSEQDRFMWFSTTGWVMWNSQIMGLLVGATICLYDGNPGYPDMGTLWRFAAETRATFFGAGAAYFANCMKAGIAPAREHDLSALKSVGSTGSPLSAEAYAWIYAAVGRDIFLACISGGTDVAAAFVGSCPTLPLYAGEMQCRCLGVKVEAWDEAGRALVDEVGELMVSVPMPTMPLYFLNDAGGKRYHDSYFSTYPGVWRHGDWLRITKRGGAIIYGRSDTTINRHGIRMGTAEIYRVVEEFDEVTDSLVVDLEYLGKPSWMPLFVVLRAGLVLDEALMERLRSAIRSSLSARHVPDAIMQVAEVPRTLTGKKMELPVKKILLGMDAAAVANRDAMANPASLEFFRALGAQRARD